MSEQTGADIERRRDVEEQKPGGPAELWKRELDLASAEEKTWREDRAPEVLKVYKGGQEGNSPFNILWSNTEVLKALLYSGKPVPDVRRRHQSDDQLGRQVATALERALGTMTDMHDVDGPMMSAIEDMLLPGRGVARVVYRPRLFSQKIEVQTLDGQSVTETMEGITDQAVWFEHWHWRDFRLSPARAWKDVRWVAYAHDMTRDEMETEFPTEGPKVTLNSVAQGANKNADPHSVFKRARVWEIWCKEKRERHWYVDGHPKLLDTEADPLGLEDFFDCPEPLYGVRSTDSMVPIPEYTIYQKLAEELNNVTRRISKLIEGLKRRGVYDASVQDGVLAKLAHAGDNEFIPVEAWQHLMDKGGLDGVFAAENIEPIGKVLVGLFQERTNIIQTIYEVTGIADIMRGATDPRETATAQRTKAQFGSLRPKRRQERVQRFVRDLYRIESEIIAEKFAPSILSQLSMMPVDQQMMQVLRDDRQRGFMIDVETDATVFEDAEQEKKARVEFLGAAVPFLEKALLITQQMPAFAPLMFEFLEFGIRGFKVGRTLEEAVEQTKKQVAQQMQQPRQDPKMAEAQGKMQIAAEEQKGKQQIRVAELQAKVQSDQQEAQAETQLKQIELQLEHQREMTRIAQEQALKERELRVKAELDAAKAASDASIKRQQANGKEQTA